MYVLIIEDNPDHDILIRESCRQAFPNKLQIESRDTFFAGSEALQQGRFDLCICDLNLPDSTADDTIARLGELENNSPIVVLTSHHDDHAARALLNTGIQDFLPKDEVTRPHFLRVLNFAIERHAYQSMLLDANRLQAELILKLEAAGHKITHLEGIIPICASCKQVRKDDGFWQQVEAYVHENFNQDFSHGICPDCLKKHYPEFTMRDNPPDSD